MQRHNLGAMGVDANNQETGAKKYYSFAGMLVAMDDGTDLVYFASDHLSSASLVMDDAGNLISEQRYMPFGEVREDVSYSNWTEFTDFGYTGQRDYGDFGLMDYRARFYSPRLGRFTQPDTIIPNSGNPQALNKYSYVYNNPVLNVDPTGHNPHSCMWHRSDKSDMECSDGTPPPPPVTPPEDDYPVNPEYSSAYCDQMPEECVSVSSADAINPLIGMYPTAGGYVFGGPGDRGTMHPAVDVYGIPDPLTGNVNVYAPTGGWLYYADLGKNGFGLTAIIRVPDGQGSYYTLIFAHLAPGSETFANGSGQWVNQGDAIGAVGLTGATSGYHLHYEVRHDPGFQLRFDNQGNTVGFYTDTPGVHPYHPSQENLDKYWINPWLFSHLDWIPDNTSIPCVSQGEYC